MNVICYKRVSTEDQKDNGFSLQHQEDVLRKYCEINDYNIVGMYTEDFSAKTFDRPEWKKIIKFIKQNKSSVDIILCLRWDRFSRNLYDALTTIKVMDKLGVKINTVEQPLDLSNPDNKILLSMYLTLPEIENDKNSIRTIDGSRRARKEGCWTGTAPKGYTNCRDENNKSTLAPNSDAPLIAAGFKRLATGGYFADEVRKWMNSQGMKLCKQTFLNMIPNPVYLGKIKIKEYKKEPAQLVEGLHPAIVTEEVFNRANEVLSGRKKNIKSGEDKSDLYPLKGFLWCPLHNRLLTAYGSGGRNKVYHYYVCESCREKKRHRIADAHKSVEDILTTIQFNAQTLLLYKKVLEKLFNKEDLARTNEINKVKTKLEQIKQRKNNIQERYMDADIDTPTFNEMMDKINSDTTSIKNILRRLESEMTPFRNYVRKTLPMLENLVEYYRNSDGKTKQKILESIFAEKLILKEGKVVSYEFTTPIHVLQKTVQGYQKSKEKQTPDFDPLPTMNPILGVNGNVAVSIQIL